MAIRRIARLQKRILRLLVAEHGRTREAPRVVIMHWSKYWAVTRAISAIASTR